MNPSDQHALSATVFKEEEEEEEEEDDDDDDDECCTAWNCS